jgi:hypothetical protein
MFDGQTIWMQFVGQRTVTVNWQQLELPALSTAQHNTLETPTGKSADDGGVHRTKSSWQLSEAFGAG